MHTSNPDMSRCIVILLIQHTGFHRGFFPGGGGGGGGDRMGVVAKPRKIVKIRCSEMDSGGLADYYYAVVLSTLFD